MKHNKSQLLITGIAIVVIVLTALFGGTAITVSAANNALPGDTLYGVKSTLEQTRLSMARDSSVRAGLYLQFAETRMQEISLLVSEKRFNDIPVAMAGFETLTTKAMNELEVIAQDDPQQAAVLTAMISENLSRYERTLTSMLDSVPDPVRQDISQVVEPSQGQDDTPVIQAVEVEFEGSVEAIVEGAWIIAGKTIFIHTQTEVKDLIRVGDYVKVHAVTNSDGDLVAREIELTGQDDEDTNSNDNDNTNTNENANSNANINNANGNDDNSNNDNTNSNSNVNDDNGNDNNGSDDSSDDSSSDDSSDDSSSDDSSDDNNN